MKHILLAVALGAMAFGCVAEETGDDTTGDGTGDGSGSGSGSAEVTCSATGTATAVVSASRIDGVGKATCSAAPTSITVETCIQWKSSSASSFTDIGCASASKSGVSVLEEPYSSGCGLSTGKVYRTKVTAKINGNVVAEAMSSETTCN
jgi:hypothetical protein